jgi:hypothetical protein
MKLNQYGQNLVLLDQDEVHVLSTFCFQLYNYKKHYHMVISRGSQSLNVELLVLGCREYHENFVKMEK